MSEYKKLFKNFFFFILGDFGAKFISFLMVPFYTGILTTSQYGEIDLIISSTNLIIPIISLNCSDSVFRFVMSKNTNKKTIFTTGIMITFCGLLVFLLFLPILFKYVTRYSVYLYLITSLNIYYSLVTNYIKALGKVKIVAFSGFFYTLLFVTFNIITLKYLSLGVTGYFISNILALTINTALLFLVNKLWKDISLYDLKSSVFFNMIKYSLPLIPTNLCWWIVMLSDRYMINWMLGTDQAGLYAIANKVPSILQIILTVFMQAWQISIISVFEDNEVKAKIYFEKILKYIQGSVFIITSIILIFIQFIMFILARNDFYTGWILVPFLLISISFSFINGVITTIYQVKKKNMPQFYSTLGAAILNIILNLLLINYIGAIGATISSCISYALIMIIRLKDTEKYLSFNRNYNLIFTNSLIIVVQAISYILIDDYLFKYFIQIIFLVILVFKNRFVFLDLKERILKK